MSYQPSTASSALVSTAVATIAGMFAQQPNVSFFDVMNEINYYPASGWGGAPNAQSNSDLSTLLAAVRAVAGPIPVVVSVGCVSVSDYTGVWMQAAAQQLACPFLDVHTYTYQTSGTAPLASDFAALRGAPWYPGRFVVGETGVPSTDSFQTSWVAGNGTVAAAADCLGSIYWGATDTSAAPGRGENVSNFGLMDSTGTTLRPALTTPLAAWPGVL